MKTTIRKMGNSQGVIFPKPLLAQVGLEHEAEMVEGWAEASQAIAAAGDDGLVWPEFGNEDDTHVQWCKPAPYRIPVTFWGKRRRSEPASRVPTKPPRDVDTSHEGMRIIEGFHPSPMRRNPKRRFRPTRLAIIMQASAKYEEFVAGLVLTLLRNRRASAVSYGRRKSLARRLGTTSDRRVVCG